MAEVNTTAEREGAAAPEVLVRQEGPVLIITFNRPEKLNAMTRTMLAELGRIIKEADADPSVRVLLFTGNGRAFCSGADASSLAWSTTLSYEERMQFVPEFTPRQCKVYKPSICAVNGMCAGAGLHFVADCDIVIAGQAARFTDTHVNIGQVTALEPIGLSRRMPLGAVLRMVILGKAERLDAQRALALGMVSEVLPDDGLMARALELAHIAAGVSPAALRVSLKAVWDSFEIPLPEAYERGLQALMLHRDHPDASEGPKAFLEKRAPNWLPE